MIKSRILQYGKHRATKAAFGITFCMRRCFLRMVYVTTAKPKANVQNELLHLRLGRMRPRRSRITHFPVLMRRFWMHETGHRNSGLHGLHRRRIARARCY